MSLFKEKLELKAEEVKFKAQKALGSFASWQKWIFLSGVVLFLPAYFIAKNISLGISAQNYKGLEASAHPSFTEAKNLILDRIDVASLGENTFAAVGRVTNPNLDLAAKEVPYEFQFLDKDGLMAAPSEGGVTYLLPNEQKYLVAPKVNTQKPIAQVKLLLPDSLKWQKKLNLPTVKIVANEPKGRDQTNPYAYVVEGAIQNLSAYQLQEVKITFLLYGTGGKIIGASQRSEFNLKPSERRDYKQIWSGVSGSNVVKIEALPATNLLDKNNLVVPDSSAKTGGGDLGR